MQQFQAVKPDLDLELKMLSGDEITLKPKKVMSGQMAIEITKFWTKTEKEQKEKDKEGLAIMEVIAAELAYIYPKDPKWFLDNFDVNTLNDILMFVAESIGGIKKREKS